jgi:hypothetical protein
MRRPSAEMCGFSGSHSSAVVIFVNRQVAFSVPSPSGSRSQTMMLLATSDSYEMLNAVVRNATNRPSAEIDGWSLSPRAGTISCVPSGWVM